MPPAGGMNPEARTPNPGFTTKDTKDTKNSKDSKDSKEGDDGRLARRIGAPVPAVSGFLCVLRVLCGATAFFRMNLESGT